MRFDNYESVRKALFQNISLKTNSDKCHLLLRDTGCQVIDVCHKRIENLRCEKQLGRVTYRFLYAKRHNDALEWGQGGGGLSLMTF